MRLFIVFFSFVLVLLFAACGGGGGNDSDLDSGPTDTDTDSDTDTDADSDTDSDTDTDTYTDADTDIDAGVDSGSDTDTDGGVIDCAGGRLDVAHNLCWQHPKASETYAWQDAIDYCDALDLAGHTDWVLPTRQDFVEMLGNCDAEVLSGGYGFCDSCAESDTCSEVFGSDTDWYWSSSPYGDDVAWLAYFNYGLISWVSVDNGYDVRCVRPGP